MSASTPILSVIVPTRDRSGLLRACLLALAQQTASPDAFEVIVVDDGSLDRTPDVLQETATPYRLRTVRSTGEGAGAARNRGTAVSEAALLLFLDDDIEASPVLVAEHLAAHHERSVVAIGRLDPMLRAGAGGFERYLADWWVRHDARMRRGEGRPDWTDCYAGNVSVERAAFVAVGGFAADLPRSEDVELGFRLHEAGHRFVYLDRAAGRQTLSKPVTSLRRDATAAGEVGPILHARHPAMLARLELGRFGQARTVARIGRGILVRTGLPDAIVGSIDRLALPEPVNRRWYGFLTNLAYWQGVRRTLQGRGDRDTWRRLTRPPIVLMYHAFGRAGEPGSRWVVPIASLRRQLRVLRWLGRTVVPLEELVEARREHRLPRAGSIAITVDDGYRDLLTALPELDRAGAPVTLFVVSDRIGRTNDWDDAGVLTGRPLLDEAELAALDSRRVAIGAHTRTHRDLTTAGPEDVRSEVLGSATDLASLGLLASPAVFAYPYGRTDAGAVEVVGEQFAAAVTTHAGFADAAIPDLGIGRLTVEGTDGIARVAANVWLGNRVLDRLPRRRHRRGPDVRSRPLPEPGIAVVIPTIGRAVSLERCLAALQQGTRLPDEVIVIDQSDGADTERVIHDLDTGWTDLRRIQAPSLGVSRARNAGWSATARSIVAFTDDDCAPDAGWLASVEGALVADPGLDAVTGRVLGLGPESPGLRAVSQRTDPNPRVFSRRSMPWRVGTGGNVAVRREALERIGGFDERLGPGTPAMAAEDLALLDGLLQSGARIRYEPAAIVHHELQAEALRRQKRFGYGRGLGALSALALGRGDPFGGVILGAWMLARIRLLAGATLRPDRPRAAERALDERLLLRGVLSGLVHGLCVGNAPRRPGPPT